MRKYFSSGPHFCACVIERFTDHVFFSFLLLAKDSFNPKMFFKIVGLSKKTPSEIERVFKILDQDKSGFIEQDELQLSFWNFFFFFYLFLRMQVWNITFIAAFTLFLFCCGCTSSDSSCRTSAKAPGPWLQPRPDPSFWRETRTEMERSAGKVSRQEKVFLQDFSHWKVSVEGCNNWVVKTIKEPTYSNLLISTNREKYVSEHLIIMTKNRCALIKMWWGEI